MSNFLQKYGDFSVEIQRRLIVELQQVIVSDLDYSIKVTEIVRKFRQLYPPKGGLSDFIIWRNDFNERKKINQEFNDIGNQIWYMIKSLDTKYL